MANSRYYSSTAIETNLTASINNSVTSISVASTTGFPGSLPYTLALDYGSASNELVEVTAVGGLTLTVTRGIDGTSATSHGAGAVVRHVSSARDFTDSRTHESSTTGVHGVTGTIVDTSSAQTLANKTLTLATGSLQNVDIFNDGSWITAVIGETVNDGVTRFHVLDDETSLNELWAIGATGNMVSRIQSYDTDGTYRIRVLATDGTTDRFAMLSGGTIAVAANGSTTQPVVDIKPGDLATGKRAIRVATNGGANERFTVWNDGKVDITGTNPARIPLTVTGASGQSTSYLKVQTSAAASLTEVDGAGRLNANRLARVVNGGATAGDIPLAVVGRAAGQTGDLQVWDDGTGTIVARVDAGGHATFAGTSSTSTSNFTAGAGFTTVSWSSKVVAGVASVTVTAQRTGADITATSAGNIADTLVGTLNASFRNTLGWVGSYDKGGTADGSITILADGTCTLKTLSPTAVIGTGDNVTFSFTYVL